MAYTELARGALVWMEGGRHTVKTFEDFGCALAEGRHVPIYGYIDESLADRVRQQIYTMLSQEYMSTPVVIEVNTIGGDVKAALSIVTDLQLLSRACDIWIACKSQVISAGIYFLSVAPLERRVAFPMTLFCHHPIQVTPIQLSDDMLVMGQEVVAAFARERESLLRQLLVESEQCLSQLIKTLQIDKAEFNRLMETSRVFGAREAKRKGFISHILK